MPAGLRARCSWTPDLVAVELECPEGIQKRLVNQPLRNVAGNIFQVAEVVTTGWQQAWDVREVVRERVDAGLHVRPPPRDGLGIDQLDLGLHEDDGLVGRNDGLRDVVPGHQVQGGRLVRLDHGVSRDTRNHVGTTPSTALIRVVEGAVASHSAIRLTEERAETGVGECGRGTDHDGSKLLGVDWMRGPCSFATLGEYHSQKRNILKKKKTRC